MAQGDLLKAQDYFRQSLAFQRFHRNNHALSLISLGNLAIIYLLLQQKNRANASSTRRIGNRQQSPCCYTSRLTILVALARVWVLKDKPIQAATWLGLVENHPDPSVKMADIQKDLQIAHAECVSSTFTRAVCRRLGRGKNTRPGHRNCGNFE